MKIVFVAHIGTAFSHLIRSVSLANLMATNGVDISFVGNPIGKGFFDRNQISYPYKSIPWSWGHNEFPMRGERAEAYWACVDSCAKSLRSHLLRADPDIVIGTPGILSAPVCRSIGITHLSMLHGPWLEPVTTLDDKSEAARNIRDLMRKVLEDPVSKLLKIVGDCVDVDCGNYTKFLDEEKIIVAQPESGLSLRHNMFPIGYISSSFGSDLINIEQPNGGIAVVSFGTGVDVNLDDILREALNIFEHVVFVEGRCATTLRNSRLHVVSALASSWIIKHADCLVTHGGIGTVGTFIGEIRKMVFVPCDLDQAFNCLFATNQNQADVVGLASWAGRDRLGRRLPEFRVDELSSALRKSESVLKSNGFVEKANNDRLARAIAKATERSLPLPGPAQG